MKTSLTKYIKSGPVEKEEFFVEQPLQHPIPHGLTAEDSQVHCGIVPTLNSDCFNLQVSSIPLHSLLLPVLETWLPSGQTLDQPGCTLGS